MNLNRICAAESHNLLDKPRLANLSTTIKLHERALREHAICKTIQMQECRNIRLAEQMEKEQDPHDTDHTPMTQTRTTGESLSSLTTSHTNFQVHRI